MSDPELRQTQSSIASCRFTVAVNRRYKNESTGEYDADFISCQAWRQTAEFVSKYFHKGNMIAVSGRLQMRDWTDRDGNKRTSAEVVCDNVYFGESKRDSDAGSYSQNSYGSSYGSQSGNFSGYSSAPQNAPAPQVSPSPFEELEDDGELPF